MMTGEQAKSLAPVVLRYALTLVFIWFGVSQLANPSAWTGFVPEWATFGMNAETVVYLNGGFEIIAGLMLGIGVYVRPVASLLALHLLFIAGSIGLTPIGVRDFGLCIATLSIALFGADQYCISSKQH